MDFDPRTRLLIEEVFRGQSCRCGQPAARFWGKRYFCSDCFQKRPVAVEIRQVKDPKLRR